LKDKRMSDKSQLLVMAADLQHRVDCCRRKTPDGYGERASLLTVYRAACSLWQSYNRPELERCKRDAIVIEMLANLDQLEAAFAVVRDYLDLPAEVDSQESRLPC